jgi:hypothetical protein
MPDVKCGHLRLARGLSGRDRLPEPRTTRLLDRQHRTAPPEIKADLCACGAFAEGTTAPFAGSDACP